MGRIERSLSAAPHQSRYGQMGAESPYYIIEKRLRREFRPIGREVQRGRAPGKRPPPVRWLQSSRLAMAREMRIPENSPELQICISPANSPGDTPPGGFSGGFAGQCVSRELHGRFPGTSEAQPDHFPGNFPCAHPRYREFLGRRLQKKKPAPGG